MLDSQTALLSFFTQNQKEEYVLTLADGVDVRLFAPHNQVVFFTDKRKTDYRRNKLQRRDPV